MQDTRTSLVERQEASVEGGVLLWFCCGSVMVDVFLLCALSAPPPLCLSLQNLRAAGGVTGSSPDWQQEHT